MQVVVGLSASGPLRDHLLPEVLKKSKICISSIMRNVEMYMYANFEAVLVKRSRKNASGPLPDHLASQPDRKSKFRLHGSMDI
jgi:hypothetical protein